MIFDALIIIFQFRSLHGPEGAVGDCFAKLFSGSARSGARLSNLSELPMMWSTNSWREIVRLRNSNR